MTTELPSIDKHDIAVEVPFLNSGNVKPLSERRQLNAEYSESSYNLVRRQESSYQMLNIYDPDENPKLREFICGSLQTHEAARQRRNCDNYITAFERGYAIQKIQYLHEKKKYRPETYFTAVSIFDRYLATIGQWNFSPGHACLLATVSMLLAAKLDQPMQPCFARMREHLLPEEQKVVTREAYLQLEADILRTFGFDFNFPGPVPSLDRYVRILRVNPAVLTEMACQICMFAQNDVKLLGYAPSKLAACSLIISSNIHQLEQEEIQGSQPINSFFKSNEVGQQLLLNTDIWNNERVFHLTGYSIENLLSCLHQLSVFITTWLSPPRLAGFDLNAILQVKNYLNATTNDPVIK